MTGGSGGRRPPRAEPDYRAPDANPLPWQIALVSIVGLGLLGFSFLVLRQPGHAGAGLGPLGTLVLSVALRWLRKRLRPRTYLVAGTLLGAVVLVAGTVAALLVAPDAWIIAAAGLVLILMHTVPGLRDRVVRPARD